ncbi:MAG: hypothetical protein BWZ11_00280 [Bacteroidetes bacterium ADurb.BinA395]|nr:MAG: hypothetical protein BWZ11_00280 [Bacteroidetes bacterium ADurb.BinA395]
MPAPVSITGIFECVRTKSINPFPPRGITKSTYPVALSKSAVASCPDGNKVMISGFRPKRFRTSRIRLTMAALEWYASLPPFSTQEFPDFRQSEKTSKVTLGRAS